MKHALYVSTVFIPLLYDNSVKTKSHNNQIKFTPILLSIMQKPSWASSLYHILSLNIMLELDWHTLINKHLLNTSYPNLYVKTVIFLI